MILEKCDFTRIYVDSLEIEGPERRKRGCVGLLPRTG
jgi:hypothetical protein